MIKITRTGIGTWRPLILGMVMGGVITALCLYPQGLSLHNWRTELKKGFSLRVDVPRNEWPPKEYLEDCGWSYLRVDDELGWLTGRAGTYEDLKLRYEETDSPDREIVIPIFPSVFRPMMFDRIYYDALIRSNIKKGDKVLVIGTGSGADCWVAWLKSQAEIYTVDINPMAIVNAQTTARIANFKLRALIGDVTQIELPDDFRDFDYVLWNMPFAAGGKIRNQDFHDGDDGRILESFVGLLPSLLNNNGTAILLNVDAAEETITEAFPEVKSETDGNVRLFTIDAAAK